MFELTEDSFRAINFSAGKMICDGEVIADAVTPIKVFNEDVVFQAADSKENIIFIVYEDDTEVIFIPFFEIERANINPFNGSSLRNPKEYISDLDSTKVYIFPPIEGLSIKDALSRLPGQTVLSYDMR